MFSLTDIKAATNIFMRLLEHGELSASHDRDLFTAYDSQSVRQILENMAIESQAYIKMMSDTLYLIPSVENTFLGFKRSELKTAILGKRPDMLLEDYYLAMYIILILFSEFYGGQMTDLKVKDALELSRLEIAVNARLEPFVQKDMTDAEGETGFAISKMANLWAACHNEDDRIRAGSRKWYVKQVCDFLEEERLIRVLDKMTIVTTPKLDRLVAGHLLNGQRLAEINRILMTKTEEKEEDSCRS